MSILDEVHRVLDDNADIADAVTAIYSGPKRLAMYVIATGLDAIKAKRRRTNRRAIKREIGIGPRDFKRGVVTGSIVLTEAAKKRVRQHTERLFGPDGWMIGDLNIGDFTRDMLLSQAERERASAKGSLVNANIYVALAEPMKGNQTVRDVWKPERFMAIKSSTAKAAEGLRPTLQ